MKRKICLQAQLSIFQSNRYFVPAGSLEEEPAEDDVSMIPSIIRRRNRFWITGGVFEAFDGVVEGDSSLGDVIKLSV